jgi:hypothetical protein
MPFELANLKVLFATTSGGFAIVWSGKRKTALLTTEQGSQLMKWLAENLKPDTG